MLLFAGEEQGVALCLLSAETQTWRPKMEALPLQVTPVKLRFVPES